MGHQHTEPGRVLVVEDDESTALFVVRVLERGGLEAAWVSDAEQAEELLADQSFDVLLADYRLPGTDGVELAAAARKAMPGVGIAVMTSFGEGDLERAARENGADDFIAKPLRSADLFFRVSELVVKARASIATPGSSLAWGAASATPATYAQGVPRVGGAPCAVPSAEDGPSGQPPRRGSGVVWGSTDRAGDAAASRRGGTGGASWVRYSAFEASEAPELRESVRETDWRDPGPGVSSDWQKIGCEGEATEGSSPEGPAAVMPGPFERAPGVLGELPRGVQRWRPTEARQTEDDMVADFLAAASAAAKAAAEAAKMRAPRSISVPIVVWATGTPDVWISSPTGPVRRAETLPSSIYFEY